MNKAPHPGTAPIIHHEQPLPLEAGVYGSPSSAAHHYKAPADPFSPNTPMQSQYVNGPGRARDTETDLSTEDLRLHPVHQEQPVHVGGGVYESHNSAAARQPRHGTDTQWVTGYNRELPILEQTERIEPRHVEPHAVIRGSIRNQSSGGHGRYYYSGRHAQR